MKKLSIPVSGVKESVQAPGRVTTWAEMSPEKKAELRALYENRTPKKPIGLKPTEDGKVRRKKIRNTSAHGKRGARTELTLIIGS